MRKTLSYRFLKVEHYKKSMKRMLRENYLEKTMGSFSRPTKSIYIGN